MQSNSYSNLVLQGPDTHDVVASLNASGLVAYVAAGAGRSTVVMHEDYDAQESLAAELSATFQSPALLAMVLICWSAAIPFASTICTLDVLSTLIPGRAGTSASSSSGIAPD